MKKVAVGLGIVLAAIVAVLIVGALQPAEYRVERSTSISAPPSVVYSLLADFHHFSEWSPWQKIDPNMKTTFEGAPHGVGAGYAWTGNDQVGEGKMTITNAKQDERIDVKLEFLKPWTSTSQTSWILTPEPTGTKMTWVMEGNDRNLVAKTMGLFMNMDKMIGKDFEAGLAQLKVLAENEAKKTDAPQGTVGEAATKQ